MIHSVDMPTVEAPHTKYMINLFYCIIHPILVYYGVKIVNQLTIPLLKIGLLLHHCFILCFV